MPVPPQDTAGDAGTVGPEEDAGSNGPGPVTPDAGVPDAGRPDGGAPDAGRPDGGAPDAGRPDAGPPDIGGDPDGGTSTPDAGVPPVHEGPAERSPHWRASYYAGTAPAGLAVADFNRDGLPDVAVNADGRGFSSQYKSRPGFLLVLPNDGKGGLGKPAARYQMWSSTGGIAAGHVNADGIPDLVVGTRGVAGVWLGRGDGTLELQSDSLHAGAVSTLGFWPGGDAPASFIWAGGSEDDSEGSFVPAGFGFLDRSDDGTFTRRPFLLDDGSEVFRMLDSVVATVADFNEDGLADVVMSEDRWYLSLMLGRSSGHFSRRDIAPRYAKLLRATDLDGDGHQDVVSVTWDNTLQVYWGRGDGTFREGTRVSVGQKTHDIAVGDVDGDGRQDFVLLHPENHRVSLWRGRHSWRPEWLATGRTPTAAAVADLNRDGKPELLVAEAGDNAISSYALPVERISEQPFTPHCPLVLPTKEAEGAAPAPLVAVDVGLGTERVTVGDFDGNGQRDFALLHPERGARLVLGQGGGRFETRDTLQEVQVHRAAAGDFDGDGKADLAAITQRPPEGGTWYGAGLKLLWSDGQGGFPRESSLPIYMEDLGSLVAEDFNGDGRVDLGATYSTPCTSGAVLMTNRGGGVLEQYGFPDHNWEPDDQCGGGGAPVVGDFNGDGTLDFLHATLALNLNYTAKDGTVVPGEGFEVWFHDAIAPSAGDLDGDGALDLMTVWAEGQLRVMRGDGGGTLQDALECRLKPAGTVQMRAVDANGDGLTDLLGKDPDGAVLLSLGKGKGHYHPPRRYPLEAKPLWVGHVNLVGDARPELVVLMETGTLKVFPTPMP